MKSFAVTLLLGLSALWMVMTGPVLAGTILLGAMAVNASLFVLLYVTRSQWRATMAGRGLVYTAIMLALLGWNCVTYRIFGEYPGRLWIGIVLFYAFNLAIIGMVVALVKVQNQERK